MAGPAIEMAGVRHSYGRREVLRGIDLTIEPGEVFGFLGHNGAGKTTTINILTTLLVADTRTREGLRLRRRREPPRGNPVYRLPAGRCPFVRPHLTAAENLEFFAKLSGVAQPAARPSPRRWTISAAPTWPALRVGSFSSGMRQQIGIAQAVLHRPQVLFLDEPTAGLDPLGVRQLRATFFASTKSSG